MKQTVTTLAVLVAITVGVAAQATPPQSTDPQKKMPPEVVLTGCIVQGSSPTIFIFDNAKKDPANAVEKGVRYLLVASAEDLDLRSHLNHQVRVTGDVDIKVAANPVTPPTVPPDPQRPADEKTLPKLNAKSVTLVSDTCAL